MSHPVEPVQAVEAPTQMAPAAAPPKPQQAAKQPAVPQDKVTISPQSQQALAAKTKPAASGDVKHDGDNK